MFKVSRRDGAPATWLLVDEESGAEAEVAPERGGMAIRFRVGEERVLWLDESTLADASKNVRGGIPILFPAAGKLKDDRWGARELKQHGFARNLPWQVTGHDTVGGAHLRLALESNAGTRERFPFDFRYELTYEVRSTQLTLIQRYENLSAEAMPLHAGFHPYFFVPDGEKAQTRIATAATRAFDNVRKAEVPFAGFDLTQAEVDLHLHDHGSHRSRLTRPGHPPIEITASDEFTHWVVWTVAGKDYVCVEPWTAPGNALNSGERLLWLPPGHSRRLCLQIGGGTGSG